jgi:hypothetical protein
MTEKELYKRADEVLGPFLVPKGFKREQPARYARRVTVGEDQISVSKGPPSKATTHFSVWIGFQPDYMEVPKLWDIAKWDRGYLTPPYLTPVGTTWRPKYWSFKKQEALDKSLQHVIVCLEQAGFAWFELLRDPQVFASYADPTAPIPYGLANEIAGNKDQAKIGYAEMVRRFLEGLKLNAPEKLILKEGGKAFVFAASKLGVEQDRVDYYKKKLNWFPNIKPL